MSTHAENSGTILLPRVNIFDARIVFWYVTVLYCGMHPYARQWEAIGFLPVLLSAVAVVVLEYRALTRFPEFVPFVVVVLVYACLSPLGVFPRSWSVLFDTAMIPRQLINFLMFFVFAAAFHSTLSSLDRDGERRQLLTQALVILIVQKIVIDLTRIGETIDFDDALFSIYTFYNSNMLIVAIALWLILGRPLGVITFVVLAVLALVAVSAQSKLGVLIAVAAMFAPRLRWLPLSMLLLMLVAVAVAAAMPREVYALDESSGVRALFWADALRAFADSYGIGVGFGTQGISNEFTAIVPEQTWYLSFTDGTGIFLTGPHNSFVHVLFRFGVLGLVTVLLMFRSVLILDTGRDFRRNLALAGILLVSLGVNVGFETGNFVIGAAFVFALINADNRRSDLPRARPQTAAAS